MGALQVIQQQIEERLSGLGFRVLNTGLQLPYLTSPNQFAVIAKQKDIDLFFLVRANAYMVDKFGLFYTYDVGGSVKVVQGTGHELFTIQHANIRGKRSFRERTAGESTLAICGEGLFNLLTDEIVRKSSRDLLLRRI